ncbi:hypothetical protein GQ44DRAFT_625996, partial [Phaeosphaeriaceae sp. PMI808]
LFFRSGTLSRFPSGVSRQSLSATLILSTPQQVEHASMLKSLHDGKVAGIFTEATMHTPSAITEEALAYAQTVKEDSVILVGEGSTTGLDKAISIRTGLPHIRIPTTYAGSEMAPILGEMMGGKKTTRSDPKILPRTVIYDVDLTMSLPVSMSATSGINAIAHSVKALYAQNGNPIVSLLALEGIKAVANSLPIIASAPSDIPARQQALYRAWLCGTCLGSVSMSLHHKLCHTLGGSYNMPHAETHTIILPHALAYNAPNIPEVMEKLAAALPDSDGDAVKAGLPTSNHYQLD